MLVRRWYLLLAVELLAGWICVAQVQPSRNLLVTVLDENGLPVPTALAFLTNNQTRAAWRCQTDYAGRCRYSGLPPGIYALRVEKPGFYLLNVNAVDVRATPDVDVTLAHLQEVKEVVNVTASPPVIEGAQTASTGVLSAAEVLNVPYPTSRDVRNVLRYIPGVVQDNTGRLHVDGAADYENLYLLDGFDIDNPITRILDMRFSADAVRNIDVERARVPAQYHQGAGGVVAFGTGMGDDRFHISATNFIPSVQGKKGLNFDKWVPRATFSGPIRKGKAWFFIAPEFEYDQIVVKQLPDGADRNWYLRGSNLAKVQVNLTPRNILTGSFLYNRLHSGHDGINAFTPREATLDLDNYAYLYDLRDQHTFANSTLFEVGIANSRFNDLSRPQGPLPYVIGPSSVAGNYFKASRDRSGRVQGYANLFLPPVQLWGSHEFQFGTNLNRLSMNEVASRRPILINRTDGTLQRESTFSPTAPFSSHNLEASAYAQDRWMPAKPVMLEAGLRYDWDQIVRRSLLSPRLAATWMVTSDGNTKLSAGLGISHDPTFLSFITAPFEGQRVDQEFAPNGITPVGPPLVTTFTVNQSALQAPRYLNYSLALERKLFARIYLRTEYIRKRGANGFVFLNTSGVPLGGDFLLTNTRQDHFDSFQITAHRTFKENYEVMASYTRSSARSNQVFDFTIDNPIFSLQSAGPLAWNTPNRFLTWGWVPLPHFTHWSLAWSAEVHSGFAFSAVNENQQVVGRANSYRFPNYVSISPFLEYRFRLHGHDLALRGGFENITGHTNPTAVDNNIDSPHFLTFSGLAGRVFTARIRFLGRK